MKKWLLLLLVSFFFFPSRSQAQTEGIFADFQTPAGNFTIRLDYINAPRAVAHFIALAEGSRPWVDTRNGAIRNDPYYTNTTLSSVLSSVTEIQTNRVALVGGERYIAENEMYPGWMGGPGFTILDETDNGLSHSNGVISFVSTTPHSIASAFCISMANTSIYFDGIRTIFGYVASGRNVLESILSATMDPDTGMLQTPVGILSVNIRREGFAANQFNIHRSDLPIATNAPFGFSFTNQTDGVLHFRTPAQSDLRMFHTETLLTNTWEPYPLGFNLSTQNISGDDTFSTLWEGWENMHFFHTPQVYYPICSAIPLGNGIIFAAEWDDGRTWQYHLNLLTGTGTYWVHTNGIATGESGDVYVLYAATHTANSTRFEIFCPNYMSLFSYFLGFPEQNVMEGTFYVTAGSVWNHGTCVYLPWEPTGSTGIRALASEIPLLPTLSRIQSPYISEKGIPTPYTP